MLFWLAEASAFDRAALHCAFDAVVTSPANGARQSGAFRQIIPWEPLQRHLVGGTPSNSLSSGLIGHNEGPSFGDDTARHVTRAGTVERDARDAPGVTPPHASEPAENLNWREAFERLEGAFAPSTLRSHLSDVTIFVEWCEENRIVPFPASVSTVCQFLEDQAPGKAPSTVRRRLYAVRKVHRLLHLPDPTWDEDINITIRRIRCAKLSRPKQAKGLTRKYLDAFLDVQDDSPWGLRNRAMLSLGYELLTRRSELVALSTQDIEFREDGTLRVIIRRSKADPFGEGRIAFTSIKTASLVRDWLDWRGPHITYRLPMARNTLRLQGGLSSRKL